MDLLSLPHLGSGALCSSPPEDDIFTSPRVRRLFNARPTHRDILFTLLSFQKLALGHHSFSPQPQPPTVLCPPKNFRVKSVGKRKSINDLKFYFEQRSSLYLPCLFLPDYYSPGGAEPTLFTTLSLISQASPIMPTFPWKMAMVAEERQGEAPRGHIPKARI